MTDAYQVVTDRIIKELEKGNIPWRKPWIGLSGACNFVTGHRYSLLNQLILKHQGAYASYKQWEAAGGHVRKGEKGEKVCFWKYLEVKETSDVKDDGKEEKKKYIPYLKYHTVFHISQTDGIDDCSSPCENLPGGADVISDAEDLIARYVKRESLDYRETESSEAYYNRGTDLVVVPMKKQFYGTAEFYSTVFHELVHSTGHTQRLDRFDNNCPMVFGDSNYSKEELTAEIGSSLVLSMLKIETGSSWTNTLAYISSWLGKLKNDKRFIVGAAGKAEKAVQYILEGKERKNEVQNEAV